MIGHLHRQRLDVHLARDLTEHAALLDTLGLADELDDDLGLDRLVEPHLVQVDVQEPGPRGVELVLLEHRVVRGLLTVEDDVEDRVETVLAGQRAAKLPLLDVERMRRSCRRRRALPGRARRPQTPRLGASARLARLDVQLDALAGHFGRQV